MSWRIKSFHLFPMKITGLRKPKRIGVLLFFFFCTQHSYAASSAELPPFTANDKVLILAPHPDDEIIAAGGVIQRAVSAGAKVKVVLLTNGENNLGSFMVYDKRFFFGPKRIIRMGLMRKQETVTAMQKVGLAKSDVVSLGYPDNGTLKILTERWVEDKPLSGKFSHARRVPYFDALSAGEPYLGQNILKDLEQILLEYKPTQIFVSHPADKNTDHQAFYLFMRVALWDLEGKIDSPQVYPYLVHLDEWPSPQGYQPELKLDAPPELLKSHLTWHHLDLSLEETSKKFKVLQDYPSQIQYAPNRLVSFVRQNELFSDYPVIKIDQTVNFDSLSYAEKGDHLVINLKSKRMMTRWFGASIFLLGYKKSISFSDMPKIEIHVRLGGLSIKDKQKSISKKKVKLTTRGKEWSLSIPFSMLGDPEFVLSRVQTRLQDLSNDQSAWRVLSLRKSGGVRMKKK